MKTIIKYVKSGFSIVLLNWLKIYKTAHALILELKKILNKITS